MPDRRFPICSADVPACVGREALLQRMLGALTKPVPDHLQVIGARFAGETALVTEVIRKLAATEKPYTAFVHWDLGHRTPANDDEFLKRLKQELIEALKVRHPDYAEYLKMYSLRRP
jgi:Ni2+-binding GTPase involved in maturation of urease and hydrogenase